MTEKEILTYIKRTILNGNGSKIEKVLKRRWKLDTSYELAKKTFEV